MHLFLSAHGDDRALLDELARTWPTAPSTQNHPGLIAVEGDTGVSGPLPLLVFSRQMLPGAKKVTATSIRAWAEQVSHAAMSNLSYDQPWRLHVIPHYNSQARTDEAQHLSAQPRPARKRAARPRERTSTSNRKVGLRRCALIHTMALALMKDRGRRLARQLHEEPTPWTLEDSLVQLLLTSPDTGWLSVAPAPMPYTLRQMVWPFLGGEVPPANDKAAPSRAFAKLLEAEQRLGRRIGKNETCVDLGASPGSWSYVVLRRGGRVTAVDRSPLRDDLMGHPQLQFIRGDAFQYAPQRPVDWLLCDVIAAPERNIALLLDWIRRGWAKQFVMTIKFQGRDDYPRLDRLKAELPALATEWFLVRLTANKNEACAFGMTAANTR